MAKQRSNASMGASLIVLSSLFYASYGVWTTLMGDFFGGYTASALRSIIVLIILLPVAIAFKKIGSFNLRSNGLKLGQMVVVSVLIWGLLYYSVLQAGIGISFAINYGAITVGLMFFGWLFDGDTFTPTKSLSILFGLIGMGLVFIPSSNGDIGSLPLIAALISGLAVAVNTILAKQLPYNTTQSTLALWCTSVLANVPMMFILQEPIPALGWHIEWLYLVFFAIASIIASWLVLRGIVYVGAGMAGILGLLEIVFGVLFGAVLFDERIGAIALTGVVVIILAAALPYIIHATTHQKKSGKMYR